MTAVSIAQLVAYEAGEYILCVKRGGYTALHKLFWWDWGDRTYCLIFLLHMSASFEFGVFLSRDAMLARYAVVVCPSVRCECSVYRRLSDWTRIEWTLHS